MYRKSTYTHGSRTALAISSINSSDLRVGDSVFNTTWKIPEFWDGNTWTNEHCVTGFSTSAILPGQPLRWYKDPSLGVRVDLATTTTKYRFAGICVRSVQTGPVYTNTIAIKGKWPIRFTESVTRGEFANLNGTGTCTANSTTSAGTIGMVLESITYSGTPIIVMCHINGIEKY